MRRKIMLVLLLAFVFVTPSAFAVVCPDVAWHKSATIKRVNDGDTITLTSGKLVRIIGIDTPEIDYRNISKSEPYALQAKALLEKYVSIGDKVYLFFDQVKRDKYGRQLAYVYSKTGRNLAVLQLQAGYARQWVIGKNDRLWRCLQIAEKSARSHKKGIWSDFSPADARTISRYNKGYQYIRGRISAISRDKKGIVFFLDRKLMVRISTADVNKFSKNNIDFREHQQLLIAGRVRFYKGQAQLRLYHPVQILP